MSAEEVHPTEVEAAARRQDRDGIPGSVERRADGVGRTPHGLASGFHSPQVFGFSDLLRQNRRVCSMGWNRV